MPFVRIYAESADNEESRALGLMHRKMLGKNSGMFFSFNKPMKLSFWMKDTHIPLDIAYIGDDLTVSEIREMIPYSTRGVRSSREMRYAVEANSGFFAQNGIGPGSRVLFAQQAADLSPDNEVPGAVESSPDAVTDTGTDEKPGGAQTPAAAQSGPKADLLLNKAIIDIIPMANQFRLAIAFDYEYPEGNIKSYYMLPMDKYEIKQGIEGRLLVGRCSHSFGEYRCFRINNITGYDLYETQGPRAGRRVAAPLLQETGKQPASPSELPTMSSSREQIIKESEYSVGQLMMTEYWDEISKKRDEGKTEGEAILEYLSENSKRNSPRRRKKEGVVN